jgi:predicted dehydrogenase
MSLRDRTGVVIIGAGYWGLNHIRIFKELADAEVLAVCDVREERLAEVSRRFPDTPVTTDVADALNSPHAEAIIIATHATTHRELVARALINHKHVLVEKPLTTSSRDAAELTALAERHGCILLVGHTFLYNAAVQKVRECVRTAEIGRPYYLYARRTNLGPIRFDVNAVWDLAPHDVAIFIYLLDAMPIWASAVGARALRNAREDVAFISLGFPDGVLGHIHVSWADPMKVREVVVVGSDKRVVFDDLDTRERVRIFEKGVQSNDATEEPTTFGEHSLTLRDGAIISPPVPTFEPLKHQCGHFIHCIRRAEKPLTDGAHGEAVVRVMEAISESVERSGAPVSVDLDDKQFETAVHDLARSIR